MSDIVADLRTHLLTQSGVTNEVGTRIYFDHLPQGAVYPAIILEQNDLRLIRKLDDKQTLRRAQIDVQNVAESHTGVRTLQAAVQAAIEFETGTWGSTTVRRAYIDDEFDGTWSPQDGSELHIRVAFTTVNVWFVDA